MGHKSTRQSCIDDRLRIAAGESQEQVQTEDLEYLACEGFAESTHRGSLVRLSNVDVVAVEGYDRSASGAGTAVETGVLGKFGSVRNRSD